MKECSVAKLVKKKKKEKQKIAKNDHNLRKIGLLREVWANWAENFEMCTKKCCIYWLPFGFYFMVNMFCSF